MPLPDPGHPRPGHPLEIVCIDDDPLFLKLVSRHPLLSHYRWTTFSNPEGGIQYIKRNNIALVLTDYKLPTMDGGKVIAQLKLVDPFLPILGVTVHDHADVGKEFTSHGSWDVLLKPCQPSKLRHVLDTLLVEKYLLPGMRSATKKKIILLKIGGSVQDRDVALDHHRGLRNIIRVSEELQEEGYQMIVTVGVGPLGEVVKQRYAKYGQEHERLLRRFPVQMKTILDENLHFIESLYQVPTSIFHHNSLQSADMLNQAFITGKIILASTAPRHLTLGHSEFSPVELLSKSDYQTLKLAEYFQQTTIVFVKDTPGIFAYDPLRGEECGAEAWKKAQRRNRIYNAVTIDQLLSGEISRLGTDGRGDHLIEDAALQAMDSSSVGEVAVVCPEYSWFYPAGHRQSNLDDRQHLKQSILAAIGDNHSYQSWISWITKSRKNTKFVHRT